MFPVLSFDEEFRIMLKAFRERQAERSAAKEFQVDSLFIEGGHLSYPMTPSSSAILLDDSATQSSAVNPPRKVESFPDPTTTPSSSGPRHHQENQPEPLTEKKRYMCSHPGCPREFDKKSNCESHMLYTHRSIEELQAMGKSTPCPKCGQHFKRKHDMEKHVETKVCDKLR